MAGMHFIILKVNGVDVSQMPHEEAVQMFLKASEPILVEVRRRSYKVDNVNESAECADRHESNDAQNQKDNLGSRRQSPTISQLTSPAKHQKLLCDHPPQTASVDSLKFHSLYISSSQNSVGLDSSTKMRIDHHANNSGSPQIATQRNNNNSASTSLNSTSNNQIPKVDETANQAMTQSRSASISSATSPSKSVHLQSATSSPFKEATLRPLDDDDSLSLDNKGSKSIGIQTDNFTTDFIFSGSSMLNTEQIIGNEHNLFSECMAPEIDIEAITLRKSDSNERLGLTVCYSSGGGNGSGSDDTDTCTEVYISDIVPDSIAGRDGRLRQGDQILQVNGKDVSNKEETETLIAENNNAVTLLVSRYLYGDDDEFNEQGDYYDEDEPNMKYANCFLGNYIFSDDLPKSAKSSHVASPEKKLSPDELPLQNETTRAIIPDIIVPSTEVTTATTSSSSSKDPLNHHNIRAHLEQVNQEIAILDSRVENMMSQHAKALKIVDSKQKESSVMQLMDYDTEHIYETIPEDSESEPFYCSPYESSEHQTRIEQWLGMQEASDVNETNRIRSLQHKQQQSLKQNHENLAVWTKTKNGTVHSTNSSAGDDHENSSSAYNTGGSCNSNTMTPLTLELNTNYRDREQHFSSTLILCPTKHNVTPLNEATAHHRISNQSTAQAQESIENVKSTHRFSKEKLPSPTHSSKVSQSVPNKQKSVVVASQKIADVTKSNPQSTPISATNTMYTNVANLQQTMLLQQQLFRQALIHQRVPSNSAPCPQFTAPNLSQYHFVSSQEVSTVKLNTHPSEEHMVWKVKRRQDGTRYIVRRPARNRFLRNRALRISAERNDQTTEDDTISEIKTGRYWTKEERKKHIERARERRQRQQIIITKKNNEIAPSANNCVLQAPNQAKGSEVTQPNAEFFQQQAMGQPKLSPSLNTLNTAATTAKVYRQNTLTGQNFSKKLAKKNSNSPIIEVSTSASTATNTTNVVGTGTIKSTPTPSGNKMPQGSVPVSTYYSRVVHPPM